MATYESLIKIKGTVGGLVFYELNGKNVVRKKSGFNKTAFKKSPAYEKVRQNSSEFGHCSKTGKVIRTALDAYIRQAGDPLLYQQFAKVMTEIKNLDLISERGKRTVKKGLETEQGKALLKAFTFGTKANPGSEMIMIKNNTIHFGQNCSAKEAVIVTLKIDFERYTAETIEKSIAINNRDEINFENHFLETEIPIYFMVLKKNGDITHMGFV
ncbi:hypothetical protein IW15_20110 [Chryseobacterium soli]|uniref:Uncharacterized protein n=1 Tax=Chryseobacterium soli TaxID=445961 RepID=A0A086A1S1_9FLAO|nr:hypothetical protein [Chryseobacterium soli]KFF10635.1 hypothetical protein IW15_20110 [Chryseobacterium soli]